VVTEPGEVRSRRGLLGGAAAAVGAVVVTGCGGSSGSARTDSTASETGTSSNKNASPRDVGLLAAALELERRTVNAYVACIPLLSATNAKAASGWLSAELEHTGELIGLIGQAGGKAQPRANSYEIGPMPSNQAETLALLANLEQLQISYYLKIMPKLQVATARASVSSILSSDAQHVALLRLVQGKPAVPSAFLT
jgi:Ferritin-like domain